jgi:hypothetical protein
MENNSFSQEESVQQPFNESIIFLRIDDKINKTARFLLPYIVIFFVVVIIAGIGILRFVELSDNGISSLARSSVAAPLKSTIAKKHADYLISGNDYTAIDVVKDTPYANGFYMPTVDGNVITWVCEDRIYKWTYIPRNGDTSAYLTVMESCKK